jgi:hypothetical protein
MLRVKNSAFDIVPSLCDARKDVGLGGTPITDKNPSEWALAYAVWKLGDKPFHYLDEIWDCVCEGMAQQYLDGLCTKNIMQACYDESKQDLIYTMTPFGKIVTKLSVY